jgi:hypothetical protein
LLRVEQEIVQLREVTLSYLRKLRGIFWKRGNCSFPQARKHCRNGGTDTDCDWDNKQNGNGNGNGRNKEDTERWRKQDGKGNKTNEEGEIDGFLKKPKVITSLPVTFSNALRDKGK